MELLDIPKGWDEISVNEFLEFLELEKESYINNFVKNVALLSVILDVDDEYFDEFTIDEISEMIQSIQFIYKQPSNEFIKKIDKYQFRELKIITFGEFLDIDYFISNDSYSNLTLICAILYRQNRKNSWGNIEWEPYGEVDIWERSKEFSNLPITHVFGVLNHIINWRIEFMDLYKSVFKPIYDPDELDSDEEMTAEDLEEEKKEKALEKFSWQFLIDDLTGSDITKIDDVTDLPLITVFNYLVTKKNKPRA